MKIPISENHTFNNYAIERCPLENIISTFYLLFDG